MAQSRSWRSFPTQKLSDEVDRLFDELIYRRWGFNRAKGEEWTPQFDLYETSQAFVLEADLPGMRKQDVSVEIQDHDLVLEGRRSFEQVTAGDEFHCRERHSGHFLRRFRLPRAVNREQIAVTLQNGVLRVIVPKAPSQTARATTSSKD